MMRFRQVEYDSKFFTDAISSSGDKPHFYASSNCDINGSNALVDQIRSICSKIYMSSIFLPFSYLQLCDQEWLAAIVILAKKRLNFWPPFAWMFLLLIIIMLGFSLRINIDGDEQVASLGLVMPSANQVNGGATALYPC